MIAQSFRQFFLKPSHSVRLSYVRILVATILFVQAVQLQSIASGLFGSHRFIQGQAETYFKTPWGPSFSSIISFFSTIHLSESFTLFLICLSYLVSLAFLTIGYQTRIAAIAVWFLNWMLIDASRIASYGIDAYIKVFLWYFIWMPIGHTFSIDRFFTKKAPKKIPEVNLSLRVLQIHLCIAYFWSGIEKMRHSYWWDGELIWRALTLPGYAQFDFTWLATYPFLPKLLGWITMILEIGYCVFIWPKATRKIWIPSMICLHLGIAIFMGLPLFGLLMAALTPILFWEPHIKNSKLIPLLNQPTLKSEIKEETVPQRTCSIKTVVLI